MKNQHVIKEQLDYRPWICAVLLFVISFPKWFWGGGTIVITLASYLLLFMAYNDISRNGRVRTAGVIALFFQIIIVFVTNILPNTNVAGYVMSLIQGVGFATIFLCSPVFWKKIVDCFIRLLAVLLIFALVEHVMISFLELTIVNPITAQCPSNPDRDYDVFIFNVYHEINFDFFNRFYAFYDEPGALGNIMMVLLYTQKFDLKKWYNVVLLISGLFSFSLAFYIALATYYILFGKEAAKIGFAIAAVLATYYFYDNEYIYYYVFGRLEFENGQLSGYNRELHGGFQLWIKTKSVYDYLFWGYQPREAVAYAASWRWAFALYGIIPSLLYLLSISYYRAKGIVHREDILRGLVLMVVIWIQRPFIYQYIYVFLIVCPFIYYASDGKQPVRSIKFHESIPARSPNSKL